MSVFSTCAWCSRTYDRARSHARASSVYCSPKCESEYRQDVQRGHEAWLESLTDEEREEYEYEEQKRRAELERERQENDAYMAGVRARSEDFEERKKAGKRTELGCYLVVLFLFCAAVVWMLTYDGPS